MDPEAVLDSGASVKYTHWTNGYAVGFKCVSSDGVVSFVYLNPSSDDSEGAPNVFVYQGPHGDPMLDSALTHIITE